MTSPAEILAAVAELREQAARIQVYRAHQLLRYHPQRLASVLAAAELGARALVLLAREPMLPLNLVANLEASALELGLLPAARPEEKK